MKKIILYISCLIGIVVIGCDSDDDTSSVQPIADFEYTVNGGEVTFINKSNQANVYAWEFGGITNSVSTDENPMNTYLKAGTYDVEVTLYAGDGRTGVNDNVTKIISLVDVPPTIIIDGDFDDWNEVPFIENVVGDGSLQRIKADGKGDYINIYVEGTNAMQFGILEMFLDIDNDPTTGYVNNDFYAEGGSGFDMLGGQGGISKFDGVHGTADWSWAWKEGTSNFLIMSEVISISGDSKAIEMSISKSIVEDYVGSVSNQGIGLILTDWAPGWAALNGRMAPFWVGAKAVPVRF